MTPTHRQLPANGHAARLRLVNAGISERAISNRTGLGMSYVRNFLNRNLLNTSATLADIEKFRSALGLTWGDLLDVQPPQPDQPRPTEPSDASTLGNLLSQERAARPPERLATVLGWTLTRTHQAREALNELLHPAGLQVRDNTITGWKLEPLNNTLEAESARLADLTDHQRSPSNDMQRVLYEAWTGTLSNRETKTAHAPHLHGLVKRGALTKGRTRWELTQATQHALNF